MSIETILAEAREWAESDRCKSIRGHRGEVKGMIANLGNPQSLWADRERLLALIGSAAHAIAEIDAEAERGKYLEQARALLVAAHGVGEGAIWFQDGCLSFFDFAGSGDCLHTSAEPDAWTVEALARVLQARTEKSQ